VRVSATGVVLSIAGQTLTGDVAFERNSSGTTVLTVANLALSLGGGLITLHQGNGTFTIATTGMTGHIVARVAAHVPGVQVGGTFALDVNTVTGLLAVAGTGGYVEVAGQRIGADFTFTQSGTGTARTVTVTIRNLDAFFGQPGTGTVIDAA